jgi:hypothetical protein
VTNHSTFTRCASPRANCGVTVLGRKMPSTLICGMIILSPPDAAVTGERLAALPRLPLDLGGPVYHRDLPRPRPILARRDPRASRQPASRAAKRAGLDRRGRAHTTTTCRLRGNVANRCLTRGMAYASGLPIPCYPVAAFVPFPPYPIAAMHQADAPWMPIVRRFCDGFRMPANADLSTGTRAGVGGDQEYRHIAYRSAQHSLR